MKRIALLLILVGLTAVTVMGQEEITYRYALRTQTLTRSMLEGLEMSDNQIREILNHQSLLLPF